MKSKVLISYFLLFVCLCILSQKNLEAQEEEKSTEKTELDAGEKLVVLWTNGDREVALKMIFMYTLNAKRFKWWEDITLIVWGPSTKLLSEDIELQEKIKEIKKSGTDVKVCKGCSDQYGVSEKLEKMGLNVKYVSEFTEYIKEGRHILTL
jgi:hypothetical protein